MKKLITALLLSTSLCASASPLGCFTAVLQHQFGWKDANNGKLHTVYFPREKQWLDWTSGETFPGIWGYRITQTGPDLAKWHGAIEVLRNRLLSCGCLCISAFAPGKNIISFVGTCSTVG